MEGKLFKLIKIFIKADNQHFRTGWMTKYKDNV